MDTRIKMCKDIYETTTNALSLMTTIENAEDIEVAKAMYDAYKNTPDDENDTVEDFLHEIKNVKKNLYGDYIEEASICVQAGDEVVAGIFVADFKSEATLTYCFTRKDYQERGLAQSLITTAENRLVKLGYDKLYVYLTLQNTPAFNLFESLGFEEIKI